MTAIALSIACSSQLPRLVFLSCPLGILRENKEVNYLKNLVCMG
jgi:hypothetical protein